MKAHAIFSRPGWSIAVALLLMVELGCHGASRSSLVAPKSLLIAVDVSDRSQERLLAYAGAAYRFQRGMETGDIVRIYEFAHDPQLIYEGPPIRGRSQFNGKVASRFVKDGVSMNQPGTRTHLTLERLLRDSARKTGELSIVVLTDGGIEELGPEVLESLRSATLGTQRVTTLRCLLVGGVNQEWRSRWEDWTAPLGRMATVRGLNDIDSVSVADLWERSR